MIKPFVFVNLLSIPLCVAAGTLFFCDRLQNERASEART
jgi:uncharacterized protein involved in cysteine biosynthesis